MQHLRRSPFLHPPNKIQATELLGTVLLSLILLVAVVLRVYHIGHSSLWSDEGNTWALLSRSFTQIARDAAADIHPPGYYWLLKVWSMVFGTSAVGMRSFSALLGVLLVYILYQIARQVQPHRHRSQISWIALLTAWLAAINPFHIYYSQEARMYMLLTVAATGLTWALLTYQRAAGNSPVAWRALAGYVAAGVVGLWIHYTFPMVLLAVGLGYGLGYVVECSLRAIPGLHASGGTWSKLRQIFNFIGANLLIVLLYLPWLPTALARVFAWPASDASTSLRAGIVLTAQTLLAGPLQDSLNWHWPWLLSALILPLLGILALRRQPGHWMLTLWWVLPILLMFGAGLFSDAFLKFLLTASPAWLLLCAAAIMLIPWRSIRSIAGGLLASGGMLLALQTLPNYYTDVNARDNYAGIARYIEAVADPADDLVLLNAPGQQEVWAYYDPGIPVLALPQQRPPDPDTTIDLLSTTTAGKKTIYALFWATDEADPTRIVERWLDQNAFKGIEPWQGNLRFVTYTFAEEMACAAADSLTVWEGLIELQAICRTVQVATVTDFAATTGDVLSVGLHWQAIAPVDSRYKVTLQLLDTRNQVVAQRDSEPVGGSRPTDTWEPNQTIVDQHGLPIPIGTPPGNYRLILALYDPDIGTRLTVAGQNYMELGTVDVQRPEQPFPADLIEVQQRVNRLVAPLTLVGYSAHRKGMAHAPDTPLVPGDLVEFTLVWQAPNPLPPSWPEEQMQIRLELGAETRTFQPAGDSFPIHRWRAGEVIQYKIDIPYDGSSSRPRLESNGTELSLMQLPVS